MQLRDTADAGSITEDNPSDEEEPEGASVVEGASGLTFARHKKAPREYEEGSGSEIGVRQIAELPGSPGSVSTPDDTPSIQVGSEQIPSDLD